MMLIVLLYMLFASTFILAKAVLFFIKPLLFIGLRMSLAGALMLGYYGLRYGIQIKKGSGKLLAQIIIFHIFIAYVFEFWALQYISSAKTALIYNLSPFITALLAALLTKEFISPKKWIGLLIGFLGLIPWLLSSSACEDVFGSFASVSLPEVALLIAVTSAAYGWLVVTKLMKEFEYAPVLINGIGMAGGGVLALLSSFLCEGWPSIMYRSAAQICNPWIVAQVGIDASALLYVACYTALLILIANIICYNLYGYLLCYYSATFISFAGFICPLFAAGFGWLFLGERISVYFILTFVLILLGLYLFYQDEFTHKSR